MIIFKDLPFYRLNYEILSVARKMKSHVALFLF